MSDLSLSQTVIPGLLVVNLDLRRDNRGWFKENWQRRKMMQLGLPDFGPVQNNISFNSRTGATRGFHAEPWDKFVSVASGRIFGAWVDLRPGPNFGRVFTLDMDPETAVFVPRGVGNAFQTLYDDTVYSYLVNEHWSPTAGDAYSYVNLADESIAVSWPIALKEAELSEADKNHPRLSAAKPMEPRKMLIIGRTGQLGRSFSSAFPEADVVGRDMLDLAKPDSISRFDFGPYDTVVNAAAYTRVDAAETSEGRKEAWAVNVAGVKALVRSAQEHRHLLVHISSDYVFDGESHPHREDEQFSPLNVYGQTKAAGDTLIATVPHHYLLRTSWVIGDGNNFVRTMTALAERGVNPSVVNDQYGRLTFTSEVSSALRHLLSINAPYGIYNVSNSGDAMSWAEIAREVFQASGKDPDWVTPRTTAEYSIGKVVAPRPTWSVLDLEKLTSTGYAPRDALSNLHEYLSK